MDLLGNPPELANRPRPMKAYDVLPSYADILTICDIMIGILAGCVTFRIHLQHHNVVAPVANVTGPFIREVVLGSFLAAILLRKRSPDLDQYSLAPYRLLAALLWRVVAVNAVLVLVAILTRAYGDMTGGLVVTWCVMFCISVCVSRGIFVAHLHHQTKCGALREAVAVIGAPDVAGRLAARLAENVAIVGVFDEMENADNGVSPSCAMTELLELARSGAVDTVVVALQADAATDAAPIVRHLQSVPVQITVCSDFDAPLTSPRPRRRVGGVSMDVLADRPLQRCDLLAKTIIDKVGAGLLLITLFPLLLVIAMAIAWDSPGPVIFRQRRSGWGGGLFTIYKFRTMRHEPHGASMYQTVRNDPRCTKIGNALRRASLDELPQLWNVIRGDMSLVGPRPHADTLHAADRVGRTIIAEYAKRQRVKPGLTGWAQINGSRGAIRTADALRRRVAYDLYYIEHWSVWLDLKILAYTPIAMLTGEDAY